MDILDNPFWVLGATTRDNRQKIMELAEEKSLLLEEKFVTKASSNLINPRKRLATEVEWLPGIDPSSVEEVVKLIQDNARTAYDLTNFPSLAQANLLAAGLEHTIDTLSTNEVAEWIVNLAATYEKVDLESTMTLINKERNIAGFPVVTDAHALETELNRRRQHYLTIIKDALNHLLSTDLVRVVTEVVEKTTSGGENHAPILIDDLVDSFEVEAQEFFEKETKNIDILIEQIKTAATNKRYEAVLHQLVSDFERVVKNWDLVAQPIQVSARSLGRDHLRSHEIAKKVRGLAIELFNQHDHLEASQRLTALNQQVFAEVDEIVEQTEEDATTLDEIAKQRAEFLNNAKAHAEQWQQEITYEAKWGLIFRNKLKISPDGVEWQGWHMPLESISRLRWGGTKHYTYGAPSGITYSIFVGSDQDGVNIKLSEENIYSEFIDRLWRAVGARLLTQMLEGLKKGQRYRFGDALVDDHGVELERYRMFRANEKVWYPWTTLTIGSISDGFYIAKMDEEKVAVHLPYQEEDNVHVLEVAMRVFWQRRVGTKISDLLTQEE